MPSLLKFITANREELISRTRAKVSKRFSPKPTESELTGGVPLFLDQLVETLRITTGPTPAIEFGAARHGAALLDRGYTVAQVVHDYGDICQAITELAVEVSATITVDEFHTLNLALDNAIAEAVTEYSRLRDRSITDSETERSGVFAHELRNRLSAAQMAFLAIKGGRAPVGGSVASVVTRNLAGMASLISRALVEVRVDAGATLRQRVRLHQLLEEAEVDGSMEAGVHGVTLSVTEMNRGVDVDVDPQIISGAVANLLQNAFKFTPAGGMVSLSSTVHADRVEIAVQDQCGGLPPGKAEELFGAFQQRGKNRTGLGLGLFISKKGVESSGGQMRVRDVPGSGCVFTIDLPVMATAAYP